MTTKQQPATPVKLAIHIYVGCRIRARQTIAHKRTHVCICLRACKYATAKLRNVVGVDDVVAIRKG